MNKIDALEGLAVVLGRTVHGAGSASARVVLTDTCWVDVTVPKFGEDVQLAFDVCSSAGADDALAEAVAVLNRLRAADWDVELLVP